MEIADANTKVEEHLGRWPCDQGMVNALCQYVIDHPDTQEERLRDRIRDAAHYIRELEEENRRGCEIAEGLHRKLMEVDETDSAKGAVVIADRMRLQQAEARVKELETELAEAAKTEERLDAAFEAAQARALRIAADEAEARKGIVEAHRKLEKVFNKVCNERDALADEVAELESLRNASK